LTSLARIYCAALLHLLVNDATKCVANGKPMTTCIDSLKTATRTLINFGF
jgi:hypothetical protein